MAQMTTPQTIKINGMRECLLKVNGQRVAPSRYGKGYGEIKEFPFLKLWCSKASWC